MKFAVSFCLFRAKKATGPAGDMFEQPWTSIQYKCTTLSASSGVRKQCEAISLPALKVPTIVYKVSVAVLCGTCGALKQSSSQCLNLPVD